MLFALIGPGSVTVAVYPDFFDWILIVYLKLWFMLLLFMLILVVFSWNLLLCLNTFPSYIMLMWPKHEFQCHWQNKFWSWCWCYKNVKMAFLLLKRKSEWRHSESPHAWRLYSKISKLAVAGQQDWCIIIMPHLCLRAT
jgi:hypothetical protein